MLGSDSSKRIDLSEYQECHSKGHQIKPNLGLSNVDFRVETLNWSNMVALNVTSFDLLLAVKKHFFNQNLF